MSGSVPFIRRLAVIGVGLIGGSLARALRTAGAVGEIIGIDRDEANLRQAAELGVVDRAAATVAEGVAGADMVFLSVPVRAMAGVVREIAPHLAAGCIVTDGGSVKAEVVAACDPLMPAGTCFVGGHPIAGTEHSGVGASFATLYQGKRCILTPAATTDRDALATVARMWEAAGSEVVLMDPEKHDRVVAAISHLPHMVAYALVNAVEGYDRFEESILRYSAGGFRDFTRIASSDPAMWRDIALMNREGVLEMMDHFAAYFGQLRSLVAAGDAEGLERFFRDSKESRDAIL
ncbi:prephenate dehydrogenase/arogenate dehydrogenase family protein [Geobacter sulfurreducens]|jgi:prephenate dehydrogenase|uniref:prephenate dehydrogenase n=1 Tax=Geobacter sulfurreducens (strain ATCC 51573 / DSM 12127 / PCA) TaxID=243231 RepID=Q749Y5_GEOSL|nr:prephenate dehydrogenase/arogenate dehydrogenase family protein [Geobacter sulfurreducens]AAR35979.1 prephenate dehydrogenase [Geobacter sulfurreducens PCA]ADI85357.1 prephenate dehydrogenase [Geobacter sulfurreducens KN400]AJY68905.1 prephenate dehydrogenase [Geobacter sulfurreducens]QVW34431.1 prephenate dehydrogenase/arogenate dehydrogenase family protein [Geobacter sulfurreducens]UAC03306.1 prephenate dehydrogenase/arogenate dehydrogenase family protein [Geobacter sulfurreducens]